MSNTDDMIVIDPSDNDAMNKITEMPVSLPAEYKHKKTCRFQYFWMPLIGNLKWGDVCVECGGKRYAFARKDNSNG